MRGSSQNNELASWLTKAIKDFCRDSRENTLRNEDNGRAWGTPIVGFSRGNDPFYETLKEDIGYFYWTPEEIFIRTFPRKKDITPEDLTIVAWILPQAKKTKLDQRKERKYPSERWVRARIFGEQFNDEVRQFVVDLLSNAGYEALAPVLSPLWAWRRSKRYGLASNWSERHAAFVSSLGTFGLCDGLITPLGKAIRCGSVIARIFIESTPRPYSGPRDYCLFYTKGTCTTCITRCPAGAITKNGHDKAKCSDYIRSVVDEYRKTHYHLEGGGCGLCQTLVPCESAIPRQ